MKKYLAVALLLMCGHLFAGNLPDAVVTPGMVNPAVTQSNIDKTICASGWTKTIRPTVSYTNALKKRQLASGVYMSPLAMASFEEDHLISLEIGGHPSDERNLWPQPWDGEWGARKKDVLETKLKRMVCARQIPLAEAQLAVAQDWIKSYAKYVGVK